MKHQMCPGHPIAVDRRLVRARKRSGTRSLDLTIPAAMAEELGIGAGDYFVVTSSKSGSKISIHYARVLE